MFYLYILRSTDNRLYIGQTNDLTSRLQYHKSGNGAKLAKSFNNFELVYTETFQERVGAMRREKQLKGWTRAKKEALISQDFAKLKKL